MNVDVSNCRTTFIKYSGNFEQFLGVEFKIFTILRICRFLVEVIASSAFWGGSGFFDEKLTIDPIFL